MELKYFQTRRGEHRVYINGMGMGGSISAWFEPDEHDNCVFRIFSKTGQPNEQQISAVNSTRDFILKRVFRRLQIPHLPNKYDVVVPFLKLAKYAIEDQQTRADFVNEPTREPQKRFKGSKAIGRQKERETPSGGR